MKHSVLALALVGAVAALPAAVVTKREVPQEHSHENIVAAVNILLQDNNPDKIQDAVFGLLGAKAAIAGAGNIADADCLQQATADQAFTNAKAAGDIVGQTNALIYRALERNTGTVGLASVPCVSIKAVNVEIAALQQHQDPAGQGAQALNKQIALELVKQIVAVGGDPLQANEASTFAPGKADDATAAGNTCDDANDKAGCINTLKLRVDDLSAAEITTAAAGGQADASVANNATAIVANNATANACTLVAAGGNNATANAGGKKKGGKKNKGAKKANKGKAAAVTTAAVVAAPTAAAVVAAPAAAPAAFGDCNPTIVFGTPSDGRKEDAFEAADLKTFNHGSALNIAVISNFICTQISNKCSAGADAVTACDAAAASTKGLLGQAAADAFNSALGF